MMARVSRVINAGLASAALPQVRDFTQEKGNALDKIRADQDERISEARRLSTAGMPNDLIPSAVAGAGAGFVFGPVGALLGFAITNHFARKNREGAQAFATALTENKTASLDAARKALTAGMSNAKNDQERSELKALQDEFEQYAVAAYSPDPSTAQNAHFKALETAGQLNEQYDQWQTERLAALDKETAALNREEEQAVAMRNRLESESRAYIDANRQFQNLKQLLGKDDITQVDATTAIFSYAKLVNPGEITTDGDVQVLSAGGGLSEQLAARLNQIILGQAFMTPEIAAEMREGAKTLMRQQRQEQIERNMAAQSFASDLGIRPDVRRNISIPVSGDASDLVPTPLPPRDPDAPPDDPTALGVVKSLGGMLEEGFAGPGGLNSPAPIIEDLQRRASDAYSNSYTKFILDKARQTISGGRPVND